MAVGLQSEWLSSISSRSVNLDKTQIYRISKRRDGELHITQIHSHLDQTS
jgi:hypothetical protein